MSLRAFHVVFISLSVLLCWGFAAWCLTSQAAHGSSAYHFVGPAALLCGCALILYGVKFREKMRRLQIR